jgi:serine phosphatase RsbU (regulator of sigma subunit)
VGSVVKEMFLENGLLLLPAPEGGVYLPRAVEGAGEGAAVSRELRGDDALLSSLERKGDAILRYEVDLDPSYEDQRDSLRKTFESYESELMLPMRYKEELRGVLSLGSKKSGKMFTLEDLDLIKTLISQSVIALENAKLFEENLEKGRMEEELKIAHDIQMSMLPEKAPEAEGFSIAANSLPAREVGGDFYDFIEFGGKDREKLAVVVGDVSGKAVSGALVMAASRSVFRVLADASGSVEEVMNTGNVRLHSDIKKGMFVALLYAVLDSGKKTLTLSSAGQTQPILCRGRDAEPVYIETEGDRFPLGIVTDCRYQETEVKLEPSDTLVFYTDGVVEAIDKEGEMYGFDRFLAAIKEGRDLGAEALLAKLTSDVLDFAGEVEQHDDITLVVVKVA